MSYFLLIRKLCYIQIKVIIWLIKILFRFLIYNFFMLENGERLFLFTKSVWVWPSVGETKEIKRCKAESNKYSSTSYLLQTYLFQTNLYLFQVNPRGWGDSDLFFFLFLEGVLVEIHLNTDILVFVLLRQTRYFG